MIAAGVKFYGPDGKHYERTLVARATPRLLELLVESVPPEMQERVRDYFAPLAKHETPERAGFYDSSHWSSGLIAWWKSVEVL